MLGKATVVITLSSYSRTVEPNASSIAVTAYTDGVAITDGTSSMLTYDGSKITSCTISSSGVITMRYNRNTSTSSTKSGWMKFTYQGQTKQFNLTQKADYVTGTSQSTTTSRTDTIISINNADYYYQFTDTKNCGVADICFSANTNYTSGYTTYDIKKYKSGNQTREAVDWDSITGTTSNKFLCVTKSTGSAIIINSVGGSGSDSFSLSKYNYPYALNVQITATATTSTSYIYKSTIAWSCNQDSGTNTNGTYGRDYACE